MENVLNSAGCDLDYLVVDPIYNDIDTKKYCVPLCPASGMAKVGAALH